jgi:hypothetical protein
MSPADWRELIAWIMAGIALGCALASLILPPSRGGKF